MNALHTHTQSGRLTRSPDGVIGGVCEGLGRSFGVSPNVVRLAWLVAVLFFGTGLLLYAVLWWLLPRSDRLPMEGTVWLRRPDGTHVPPLTRTAVDRKLLGVCGGLARRWEIDVTLVRLGALVLLTVLGPIAVAAYFITAFVMHGPADVSRPEAHPVEL